MRIEKKIRSRHVTTNFGKSMSGDMLLPKLVVETLETFAQPKEFSQRHIMSIYHTHEATCAKGFITKQPEPLYDCVL